MNYYKKIVFFWLSILAISILLPVLMIVITDPCHIFHRPLPGIFFHGFSGNARCQNAGLINTYLADKREKFDSIFIGTSLSGNFIVGHIAEKTRWKRTLKLTLPGAMPIEQKIIVMRALQTENVKHVFWDFFPYQFLEYGSINLNTLLKKNEFPAYLYNNSRLDDYRYILNSSTLGAVINILNKDDYYNINAIEGIDFWDTGCSSEKKCEPFYSSKDVEEIRKYYKNSNNITRSLEEIEKIDYSSVDKYLLDVIVPYCNSDISFDMILPPVSLLRVARETPDQFEYQLYMLRYVVEKTRACKNIKVFAFGNERWITGDLAHYHDPRHFYGGVHDYILDSIATGKHVITPDNVADYEKKFIDNVNAYIPWASTKTELSVSPR